MRRSLLAIFAVLLFLLRAKIPFAQLSSLEIVGSPQQSSDEIVGVRDPNGRFCAAVQVISDMDGFSYDSYISPNNAGSVKVALESGTAGVGIWERTFGGEVLMGLRVYGRRGMEDMCS